MLELEQKYDPDDTEEVVELEQHEILSGKIEGGYSKYIDLILKKYYDANIQLRDNLIRIDSYDGA